MRFCQVRFGYPGVVNAMRRIQRCRNSGAKAQKGQNQSK
jgi:hypothetical protein